MRTFLKYSLILSIILVVSGCQRTITTEGRVYLTGSEPFPAVALETEEGRIYTLLGPITDSLKSLQNRIVRIKGIKKGKTPYTKESIEVLKFEILSSEKFDKDTK